MPPTPNEKENFRDETNELVVEKVKKESFRMTILSALLFIVASKFYLIGASLNFASPSDNDWTYNATGAWVFTICGLLEYFNHMGKFHIALIFAGIFAFFTEIFDVAQTSASIYFNFFANHMYFLEAIFVIRAHRMQISQGTVNYVWVTTLILADLCFVFGTTIDSALSWVYMISGARRAGPVYLTLLRTPEQKIAELVSACFWFTSGLLTLAVYMRVETKPSSRSSLASKSTASIGTKLSEMC